jgi:uncharacterized metal-binding protein
MNIRPKSGCSCSGDSAILLACSGASDVGEIADRVARALRNEGVGKMSCLIGVAAGVEDIFGKVRAASKILVIDGCSTECGRKAMQQGGIDGYLHLRLDDMGLEKGKTPVTKERIEEVAIKASQLLA